MLSAALGARLNRRAWVLVGAAGSTEVDEEWSSANNVSDKCLLYPFEISNISSESCGYSKQRQTLNSFTHTLHTP